MLIWGILLAAFAVELDGLRGKVNVVVLAFGMISYTTGPMLGMFLASLLTPKASVKGLSLGFALSFALVAYLRPDFYQILLNFDLISYEDIAQWSGLKVDGEKLSGTISSEMGEVVFTDGKIEGETFEYKLDIKVFSR